MDEHNLQTLKGPVKDIAVLNRALVDRDTGLFADVDVTLLPEATSARAVRALGKFFGTADRDDVLLVYFSGHGKLDQRGRLHLCMQDTDSTDLLSTALSSTRINEFADASRAGNVVRCPGAAQRDDELIDRPLGALDRTPASSRVHLCVRCGTRRSAALPQPRTGRPSQHRTSRHLPGVVRTLST